MSHENYHRCSFAVHDHHMRINTLMHRATLCDIEADAETRHKRHRAELFIPIDQDFPEPHMEPLDAKKLKQMDPTGWWLMQGLRLAGVGFVVLAILVIYRQVSGA